MSFIWWLLGSKGDLNWYFIKCALCLCVIEWQWWGWAVGHDLIMLNSSQVTQVCTPHISDIQTLSTQNITHNLDLGRYIKKQETTSDTRLILLHSRTYKIQGWLLLALMSVSSLCGSRSKFCFVSFQILNQIGQTKRDKNRVLILVVLCESSLLHYTNPLKLSTSLQLIIY